MNVEQRQAIEKRIVKKVIEDGLAAGYELAVDNGGDGFEYCGADKKRLLEELFATDEEYLWFFKDGKAAGRVYLVYGNDGWDVIADNSLSLGELLKGAEALAEELALKHG